MQCALCQESIEDYSVELHQLKLDEQRAVHICDACSRKFVAWHGQKLAKLFPTKAMKRMQGKKRGL
jgi:protein-arginine kinase activator protein McsA